MIAIAFKTLKISLLLSITSLAILLTYPIGYHFLSSNPEIVRADISDLAASGVGAYIINLDRSKDRYEYVNQNVHRLGFPVERISAIDGNLLTEEEINHKVDVKTFRMFCTYKHAGTIGCSLSHIKTWETYLKSPFEYALVFEDDVSFDPNELHAVVEELIENRHYWDITSFEINADFYLPIKTLKNNQKLVVYLTRVVHAGAYMINRKAAIKLLSKAVPIVLPVDHYFTRGWELDLKFTGIEHPRLVHQNFGSSDIGQTKQFPQTGDGIISRMTRLMSRTQDAVIRFLYNFKLYLESLISEG